MKIVSGTGNRTFSPNNTLTNQQVAIILERTAKVLGIEGFNKNSMLQQIKAEKLLNASCTYEQAYLGVLYLFELNSDSH